MDKKAIYLALYAKYGKIYLKHSAYFTE
jgi:hypothetical protein